MHDPKGRDLLAEHQEYVEHAYNPGYWVNRLSLANFSQWRWLHRHNRPVGALGLVFWGVVLAAQVVPMIRSSSQIQAAWWGVFSNPGNILGLGLTVFFFAVSLALLLQKPAKPDGRGRSHGIEQD